MGAETVYADTHLVRFSYRIVPSFSKEKHRELCPRRYKACKEKVVD